jgi:hypothetical protein
MRKNALVFAVAVAFTLAAGAAAKKSDAKTSGPTPDKALLQKLLDGWNTMDPANVAQYYEQGPHTFFDIAPRLSKLGFRFVEEKRPSIW